MLTAIIAVAVTGLVAKEMAALLGNAFKARGILSGGIERDELKLIVARLVDCDKTFPLVPPTQDGRCVNSTNRDATTNLVDVFNSFGSAVASKTTPTKYGSYTLRAECDPSGVGILFRIALLKDGASLTSTNLNDFAADKKGQKYHWNDPRTLLFSSNMFICGNTDIASRLAALEQKVARMTDPQCHRLNDDTYVDNSTIKRPIRGFKPNGEANCGPVGGDFDGDGIGDLVASPKEGGSPRVYVFSGATPHAPLANFYLLEGTNYQAAGNVPSSDRWGASSTLQDIDGDGFADVCGVPGAGGGPHLACYRGNYTGGGRPPLVGDWVIMDVAMRMGVNLSR